MAYFRKRRRGALAEQLEAVSEIEQVRGEMEKPAKINQLKTLLVLGKR